MTFTRATALIAALCISVSALAQEPPAAEQPTPADPKPAPAEQPAPPEQPAPLGQPKVPVAEEPAKPAEQPAPKPPSPELPDFEKLFREATAKVLKEHPNGELLMSLFVPRSPPPPKAGPFHLRRVGGSVGVTEQGLAGGATVTVGANDGSEATIDLQLGMPILRIKGQAEALRIKLVPKWKVGAGPLDSVQLDLILVDANGQATVSKSDLPNISRFILTPSVAAKFNLKAGNFEGSVYAKAAPVGGGVVYDGDATRGAIGTALGTGFAGLWRINGFNAIEANAGVGGLMTWNTDVSPTFNMAAGGGWIGTTPSGQKIFVRGETTVDYYNVKPTDNPKDDKNGGVTGTYVGVKAGVVW